MIDIGKSWLFWYFPGRRIEFLVCQGGLSWQVFSRAKPIRVICRTPVEIDRTVVAAPFAGGAKTRDGHKGGAQRHLLSAENWMRMARLAA